MPPPNAKDLSPVVGRSSQSILGVAFRYGPQALIQIKTNSYAVAGISAVIQIISVAVVVHVYVIAVIPIARPIFRPRINQTEPIATVLEALSAANEYHRKVVNAKRVVLAVIFAEAVVRNAVAAIPTALLPRPVLGLPTVCTIILEGDLLLMDFSGAVSL
jgi:hypothetical protein